MMDASKLGTDKPNLKHIIALLLQVSRKPKTLDELGLTREDARILVETGYFEWKRVIFPTESGYELVKWLLRGEKEEEFEFFEAVKQEALRKVIEKGNRAIAGIRMLEPIHLHVLQKLRNRQPVFYADIEKKVVKELVRWGLVKKVGVYNILDLTRLGQEFLTCFEEAYRNIKPAIRLGEVIEKEAE
ncbi:MAG: hypothetical protein QXW39_09940 [Candidatus Bathyarchaeia archaeon]